MLGSSDDIPGTVFRVSSILQNLPCTWVPPSTRLASKRRVGTGAYRFHRQKFLPMYTRRDTSLCELPIIVAVLAEAKPPPWTRAVKEVARFVWNGF